MYGTDMIEYSLTALFRHWFCKQVLHEDLEEGTMNVSFGSSIIVARSCNGSIFLFFRWVADMLVFFF